MTKRFLLFCALLYVVYHVFWLPRKSRFDMKSLISIPFMVLMVILMLPQPFLNRFQTPLLMMIEGGILIAIPAMLHDSEKKKRISCSARTVATVTGNKKEHARRRHSFAYTYMPILIFEAGTEKKEIVYRNGLPKPLEQGRKIEILYNPENPEEVCFADKQIDSSVKVVPVFITAGIAVCVLGCILFANALVKG